MCAGSSAFELASRCDQCAPVMRWRTGRLSITAKVVISRYQKDHGGDVHSGVARFLATARSGPHAQGCRTCIVSQRVLLRVLCDVILSVAPCRWR